MEEAKVFLLPARIVCIFSSVALHLFEVKRWMRKKHSECSSLSAHVNLYSDYEWMARTWMVWSVDIYEEIDGED
ncbi:unnamed protein product [Urochloa humidicola]